VPRLRVPLPWQIAGVQNSRESVLRHRMPPKQLDPSTSSRTTSVPTEPFLVLLCSACGVDDGDSRRGARSKAQARVIVLRGCMSGDG